MSTRLDIHTFYRKDWLQHGCFPDCYGVEFSDNIISFYCGNKFYKYRLDHYDVLLRYVEDLY